MEGPSVFLAAEQLNVFIGEEILFVEGNTRIGKERLIGERVVDIFSWGKHLIFQFRDCALRVHFMLYGSFESAIFGHTVTGDYPKKHAVPRLKLVFSQGTISFYSCSLKFYDTNAARNLYDFSIDTLSPLWDSLAAFQKVRNQPSLEISDVLLDQTIFAGVGNIIRNEVLFLTKIVPWKCISDISDDTLKKVITTLRSYVFQFYAWRKNFVLKKHYQIYRQAVCPLCHHKVTRKKTGERNRMSFFCAHCQH